MSSVGPPYVLMAVLCMSGSAVWFLMRSDPAQLASMAPSSGSRDDMATLAVPVDAADYTRRQPGRPLTAGLISYASVEDVSLTLRTGRVAVERRTLARPPDPRYPPRTLDTLTVDRFPLLGTRGQLTLQFFNDRLFEIGFRPDDASACARSLKAADSKLRRDANGRAERTSGSQRIATNCDLAASDVGRSLNTEPYVLWQDLRLVRERDDWDLRFGAIPYSNKTPS
jgi:hypothetical protein